MKKIKYNACYVPSADVVMLKCSTFRNGLNSFVVRVLFDRTSGVVYYTTSLGPNVCMRSFSFRSVSECCLEIRAFLRRLKCDSTDFTCPEYRP